MLCVGGGVARVCTCCIISSTMRSDFCRLLPSRVRACRFSSCSLRAAPLSRCSLRTHHAALVSPDAGAAARAGTSSEAEPAASELAALIAHLKETGAGALFVENITSPALIEQISKETGLKIGGRLFSDALSERGGPATSYVGMFEHNLGAIMTALQDSGS